MPLPKRSFATLTHSMAADSGVRAPGPAIKKTEPKTTQPMTNTPITDAPEVQAAMAAIVRRLTADPQSRKGLLPPVQMGTTNPHSLLKRTVS